MNASPLVMVTDAKVFHQRLLVSMLYRNRQCLQTVGSCDDTAVAVGLLLVGVVLLDDTMVKAA